MMTKLKIGFGVCIPVALMGFFFANSHENDLIHEELVGRHCDEAGDVVEVSADAVKETKTLEVKACGKRWEMVMHAPRRSEDAAITSVKELPPLAAR